MRVQVKRRYSINDPEYRIYSDYFDRLVMSSDILESGKQPTLHSRFYDKQGLLIALVHLVGMADTNSYKDRVGHTVLAYIPEIKLKLDKMIPKFESWCDRIEDEGRKRPTKWPPIMLEERLKTEARLDVYLREEQSIREQLANLEKEIIQEQDKQCLAFGPQGNGRLRNGQLVELDGQRIEKIKGRLLITSKNSVYYGLQVCDYREFISDPFMDELNRKHSELTKKAREEIKQTGHTNTVVPPRRILLKIHKSRLPKWPKNVRNWLNEDE